MASVAYGVRGLWRVRLRACAGVCVCGFWDVRLCACAAVCACVRVPCKTMQVPYFSHDLQKGLSERFQTSLVLVRSFAVDSM